MCGIFGIYSPQSNTDIIPKVYSGLFSMQHRGQESCGIAWYDEKLHIKRGKGMLAEVFNNGILQNFPVKSSVGHVRYATTGGEGNETENMQPMTAYLDKSVALVHNGNISNSHEIKQDMLKQGRMFSSSSDTEIFLHRFAMNQDKPIAEMLKIAFSELRGAYNLAFLYAGKLIAVRDPWGFRALFLGKCPDGAYAISSENVALIQTGFEVIREIEKGEAVIIDEQGVQSVIFSDNQPLNLCTFEFLYFTRPDCTINDTPIYSVRKALGKKLAETKPVKADVVVGVPDSGLISASGFSEASGITEEMGLAKNRYVGRSFISPSQNIRNMMVNHKLSAIKEVVNNKSVILIDDSVVRGTTSKRLVDCLRNGGAKEVHMRIASPPIKFPCYYGIDTPMKSSLISSQSSETEICKKIGADTLAFIDIQDFADVIGLNGLCLACFNGKYLPGERV